MKLSVQYGGFDLKLSFLIQAAARFSINKIVEMTESTDVGKEHV